MISWIDCDVRLASHEQRIARFERASMLASSSFVSRRRRGMPATAGAILAWAPARAGAALIVVGQWLAGERVAEVG